ncbi:hypothetical protein CKO40_13925 [Halochromatium glycolicum]|uniref:Uncharacterized protein n=1 Tax=Halochromatium glycolicum TaxID=85075 RepID=A0AAJ0U5E1_9GAMM|nr:hypothetical protein [Halochromatium glycolicum]
MYARGNGDAQDVLGQRAHLVEAPQGQRMVGEESQPGWVPPSSSTALSIFLVGKHEDASRPVRTRVLAILTPFLNCA